MGKRFNKDLFNTNLPGAKLPGVKDTRAKPPSGAPGTVETAERAIFDGRWVEPPAAAAPTVEETPAEPAEATA